MDYPVTINETFSYSDTDKNTLGVKVSEELSYDTTVSQSKGSFQSIQENISFTDNVTPSKLISIVIEDSFNFSNTVKSNADYLATISENLNVNAYVSTYKESNGEQIIDESADCWVVNYDTNAFSRYTRFSFNSFVKFNGKYYGSNNLGIYELTGDKDIDSEIPAKLVTGMIDFSGIGSLSYVRELFLYASTDGSIGLKVNTSDGVTENYRLLHKSNDIESNRIILSKGVKAVYWQFELSNDDMTNFNIEQFKVYRLVTTRLT